MPPFASFTELSWGNASILTAASISPKLRRSRKRTSSLSLTTEGESRVKAVSFCPDTEIFYVEELSENDEAALKERWYTIDDFVRIKLSNTDTIEAMRSGRIRRGEKEPDGHCARGLDHQWTATSHRAKHVRRRCVVHGVLREQERQRRTGEADAERLSEISTACSYGAVVSALRLASADASEARDGAMNFTVPLR